MADNSIEFPVNRAARLIEAKNVLGKMLPPRGVIAGEITNLDPTTIESAALNADGGGKVIRTKQAAGIVKPSTPK